MRRGQYRDPLDVLLRQEGWTCRGCEQKKVLFGREFCERGRKLVRCRYYQEARPMREQTEDLLREWWEWMDSKRDNRLGYPKVSPSCRQASSSRQWDSVSDITDQQARSYIHERVNTVIDTLPPTYRGVLEIEARNLALGAKVWKHGTHDASVYEDALQLLMPKLRAANLIN